VIIVCGFVSSGTRLLHRIIHDDFGLKAVHRSYPHWEKFWDWKEYPRDIQWVIIDRRTDVAIQSAMKHKHPGVRKGIYRDPPAKYEEILGWHKRWLEMSASIPDAYRLSYEALVADSSAETARLATHFGVTGWYKQRQVRDENAKWLEAQRS
jgi:hypothetical protein